ncbi:MAG: sulfurtransferase TusA family protein [Gammaproteobacteria bacterium]|nr:sulfurtransferase TusA family protein [Gammaproteobacteria bacterium]
MLFQNFFRREEITTHRFGRQRICGEDKYWVELPEHGEVEVCCRIQCIGDICPRPQLQTLKALTESPVDGVVEVITDNLSAVETIPAMMDGYAGKHLCTIREKDHWRLFVRRESTFTVI